MDRSTTGVAEAIRVVHQPARSRFEAHADGRFRAGLVYRISGPSAVLTDTHLARGADPAYRTELIDAALETLGRSGYYAVALCPHVRAFLRTRPDRHLRVDTRFLDPLEPVAPQAC